MTSHVTRFAMGRGLVPEINLMLMM